MEIKTIFKKAFHCLKTAVRDGYPLGFLCWEKLTWLRHLATHYFSSITTHTYRTFEAWWACGKPMQTQSLPCAKESKLRQCPFYNTSRVRYLWGRIVVSILYFANGGKEWRTKTSPSLFVKEQKKTCHVLVTLQKNMTVSLPGTGLLKCLVQRITNTILFIIASILLLAFEKLCVEHGNNRFNFIFPSQLFWNYKLLEVKYLI